MPGKKTISLLCAFVGTCLLGTLSSQASAADCDRACMTDLLDQYANALVAHDASGLPLAAEVKFTVNGRAAELGEGLWQSVSSNQGFRQDYLDTRQQVAASHMVFMEGETYVLLSVLLHLEDSAITGIETLEQRVTSQSRFQPTELGAPVRFMNDPIPRRQRHSREELIEIALTYPTGLRIGNFTDGETPFAADCYRVENGVITAEGPGMYGQNIIVHPGIIRSVAAVDEENGTVLLWMNFGHTGSAYGEGNSLITYEAFKIWGGEIHSILAFFTGEPIQTARFWPAYDRIPLL
jgi:hypothetical protein